MRNILPYFKFMVNDWLTGDIQKFGFDVQGFFANLMAVTWQSSGSLSNDIAGLARLMRSDVDTVKNMLQVLGDAEIIKTDKNGCILIDFISEQMDELSQTHNKRVLAGKKGGIAKAKQFSSNATAMLQHSESESESESEKDKTWRTDFETYKAQELKAYESLIADKAWMAERQTYHPNLDIFLSVTKAHKDFWATEAGWKHKKKSKVKDLDWKSTYNKAIDMNKVYLPNDHTRAGKIYQTGPRAIYDHNRDTAKTVTAVYH